MSNENPHHPTPCDCEFCEIVRLRARVAELERDNLGWEDECKLFLGQRDEARAALESFAHYVREHSDDPALVANAERVLMSKSMT